MTAPQGGDKQAFAALIASKLCHDLISPVAALGNALELLEMDNDADTQAAAMALIHDGAGQAARRLRFYRVAFGAAGGSHEIDGREVAEAATDFVTDAKPDLDWQVGAEPMPLPQAKMLLNLTALIAEALPRGGTVCVQELAAGDEAGFEVKGTGPMVRLSDDYAEVLENMRGPDGAREAGVGLVGLIATQLGVSLSLNVDEGSLTIRF
ncbi:MAG: histidine phosphotransferase family protein [Alphaproteobacteria bacterium]